MDLRKRPTNEQIDENLRIIEKETEQCTPSSQWYDQYASLLHFSECPDESDRLLLGPILNPMREPKSLQNYRFFSSSGNTILNPAGVGHGVKGKRMERYAARH